VTTWRSSTRYRQSSRCAGPARSAGSTTRMAAEVPMLMATRSGETQPAPTLEAAPSPVAGCQAAAARAGQRRTPSGPSRPVQPGPATAGRVRSSAPASSSAWASQVAVARWSMPVPEAMDGEAPGSPSSAPVTYSASPR
jgi:hypothetical protein